MKLARLLLLSLGLVLLTTIGSYAQTSAPPTPTSASNVANAEQSTDPVILQGCDRAVKEVLKARPYIEKLETENRAAVDARDAWKAAYDSAVREAKAYAIALEAQQKVTETQAKLIDKQDKRIEKLEKRKDGILKTIAKILIGAGISRVLPF